MRSAMLLECVGRLLPAARVLPVPRRLAGHSKWANIRHIKAQKDGERSVKFTRLNKLMRTAIAEGGMDPAHNLRLENLIEQARAINMPNSTIQAVLKKAGTDRTQARPATLELSGPGGSCLLVEVLTDNVKRSTYDVTVFLRKCGARLGPARHAFTAVGVVVTAAADLDQATEHAIEAGAEDVESQHADGETVLVFTTGPDQVFRVKKALQEWGYAIQNAETMHLPVNSVTLKEAESKLHDTLLQKLNDLNDVVRVTSNAVS